MCHWYRQWHLRSLKLCCAKTLHCCAGGANLCLEVTGPQTLRLETTPDPHHYTFDCVAGEAFSQDALYNGDPFFTSNIIRTESGHNPLFTLPCLRVLQC